MPLKSGCQYRPSTLEESATSQGTLNDGLVASRTKVPAEKSLTLYVPDADGAVKLTAADVAPAAGFDCDPFKYCH